MDLSQTPTEFSFLFDPESREFSTAVGPCSVPDSLALVRFLEKGGFEECDLCQASTPLVVARPLEYIELHNPTKDRTQPAAGLSKTPDLMTGRVDIIPGPSQIALWPGQKAEVKEALEILPNQQIVLEVYDEEWAQANLDPDLVNEASLQLGRKIALRLGEEMQRFIPWPGVRILRVEDGIYVPPGEGRYVGSRRSPHVQTVLSDDDGSMLFLDPTHEFLERRILPEKDARSWFPGNGDAIRYNLHLSEAGAGRNGLQSRCEPKFDGTVNIHVWPGFAVQVQAPGAEPRVIVGPIRVNLDYYENLIPFRFSNSPEATEEHIYLKLSGLSSVVLFQTSTRDGVRLFFKLRVFLSLDPSKAREWTRCPDLGAFAAERMKKNLQTAVTDRFFGEIAEVGHETFLETILPKKEDLGFGLTTPSFELLDFHIQPRKVAEAYQTVCTRTALLGLNDLSADRAILATRAHLERVGQLAVSAGELFQQKTNARVTEERAACALDEAVADRQKAERAARRELELLDAKYQVQLAERDREASQILLKGLEPLVDTLERLRKSSPKAERA